MNFSNYFFEINSSKTIFQWLQLHNMALKITYQIFSVGIFQYKFTFLGFGKVIYKYLPKVNSFIDFYLK